MVAGSLDKWKWYSRSQNEWALTFRARCQICSSLFLIKILLTAKHYLEISPQRWWEQDHEHLPPLYLWRLSRCTFSNLLMSVPCILQSSWGSMFFTLFGQLKASPNNRIEYLSSGRWWWMNFHQVLFKSELWWWINLCKALVWEPL